MDTPDKNAVQELVERVAQANDDVDAIADKLLKLFIRFPPSEVQMRRLSMMQQDLVNTGGRQEFCLVTVYVVACQSIMSLENGNAMQSGSKLRRSQSLPHRRPLRNLCYNDTTQVGDAVAYRKE